MRIMGLDYGSRTVGVAISDELLLTAQAKEIIRRKEENKLRRTLARIEELIQEFSVELIVLGLPLHMDQSESVRSGLCIEFKDKLERRTSLPVIMWDERLTTLQAHRVLDEGELSYTEKAEVVDKVAAALILQNYLDSLSREDPGQPC